MNKIVMLLLSTFVVGCAGQAGPTGQQGSPGVQGQAGVNGADGAQGPAGPQGPTGAQGPQGTQGVQGPAGPAGPQGDAGPQGPQGPAGQDGSQITASIYCSGALENTNGLAFTYNAIQFQNSNVLAVGGITDGAYETQSTSLYTSSQHGWSDASVVVQHDVYPPADGGWWSLSLDRVTLVVTVVYHDADMQDPTITWTMQPNQCVVNTY